MSKDISISEVAVALAGMARNMAGGEGSDPRIPYVALMTAAAFAGHIIEQSQDQMHVTLDKVSPVAYAKLLHITEVKQ